ncbi:phosphoadenylyl-sulfate reductase [Faunimonas sp. B44]|uniref:phosphoadenylyl-sulfate reductase n=1 Tax=Faunimonas sp. B44 TaxID=3461493 RepID=UPI004044FB16
MAARDAVARFVDPTEAAADALAERYLPWRTRDVLADFLQVRLPGNAALVSSFGADSAVLLHLVASIDHAVPVIFIDTGKLFASTKEYRDALVARLGLSDVRVARPSPIALAEADRSSDLWLRDPDSCCGIRKVAPLARALAPFEGWVSGRKRHQGGLRQALPLVEADGRRLKLNPLAAWSADDVATYRRLHDLPEHPLVADGYRSIGCMPCTERVASGEGDRNGRWRGTGKTECGIHLGLAAWQNDGSGI